MNTSETQGYRVDVKTGFDFDRSNPLQKQYFFFYTINIQNLSGERAQLKSRTWYIQDATGDVRKVEGPGVVGQTPWFQSGEGFEYTSFSPLPTLTGKMWGKFHMKALDGREFSIDTPEFFFSVPEEFIDRY